MNLQIIRERLNKMPKWLIIVPAIGFFLFLDKCDSESHPINDFVFKSEKELVKKYGNPSEINRSKLQNYARWNNVKDSIDYMVFYKDSALTQPEVVRLFNIDLLLIEPEFGWESGWVEDNAYNMQVKGLYGIENALYNKNSHILDIQLDNPDSETFGKRDMVKMGEVIPVKN